MRDASLEATIRATVEEKLQRSGAPGTGVALLVDGKPVFTGGIGFQDLAHTQALPDQAQFYIFSNVAGQ